VAYEKRDREAFPAAGGTLFVGSSTFAMWKNLEEDFRDLQAINRGFGGSTIPEVLYYMDRIVLPYKPAKIVLFCGTNDIAGGQSPERVFGNFQTFVGKVKKALPGVPVYYVAIHTAPVRMKWVKENAEANRLIREFAEKTSDLNYIDTASVLLDGQGRPRAEFYLNDRLHLNRRGQELWIPVLRKTLTARGPGGEAGKR
jgi:lysophospholipase L1-like esterase